MAHKMKPARLIHKFGVDIKVWNSSKFAGQAYPGGPTNDISITDLSDDEADKLHEPVLPMSSHLAQLFSQLNGGGEVQGDLLWLSLGKYPIKSYVYVPTQGGYYQVASRSSYDGYTEPHFFEYELKGVDQDETNPVEDTTASKSISDYFHTDTDS